jgi:hypothetical protein
LISFKVSLEILIISFIPPFLQYHLFDFVFKLPAGGLGLATRKLIPAFAPAAICRAHEREYTICSPFANKKTGPSQLFLLKGDKNTVEA